MNFSDYLTAPEAARFLGVSVQTVRRWHKKNILIPFIHPVSGFRLYKKDELEALLKIEKPNV